MVKYAHTNLSQSLLHQGIGRTEQYIISEKKFLSQSLLHQGIGRTMPRFLASGGGPRLSPFFIRASAGLKR